jgi:hypothetical protein
MERRLLALSLYCKRWSFAQMVLTLQRNSGL